MTDSSHFDTFLQVRLTTHDKERIKARAIEAGMQTSEYVRKRALGEKLGRPDGFPVFDKAICKHPTREAQASVALDGETMHAEHPAVKRAVRDQMERNAAENMGSVNCPVETRPASPCKHCGYPLGTEEHRLHCGED